MPITHISRELTERLEAGGKDLIDSEFEDDADDKSSGLGDDSVPDLHAMFRVGQYLRAVVSAMNPSGVSNLRLRTDEVERSSHKVELSIVPDEVNRDVSAADLGPGLVSF